VARRRHRNLTRLRILATMLLKHAVLRGIAAGDISLVFRRWKRPTVKTGGSLKTAVGLLAIEAVEEISLSKIRTTDAKRAGYASRAALVEELEQREGTVYRIALRVAGPDPRVALRRKRISSAAELDELQRRLDRFDRASVNGAWTRNYLQLINDKPAVRAIDIAESIGMEKKPFKVRVRKLKELGLTESLDIGYKLSLRGKSYLARTK
jgi:hypothetical protein